MVQTVLISDPDDRWSAETQDYLMRSNFTAKVAYSGKEVLLMLYKQKFDCLLIDIATKNHSALEVIRSAMSKMPALKIILTFSSESIASEWSEQKEAFLKMGISDILVRPYSLESLAASMEGDTQETDWKNVEFTETKDEQDVTLKDRECTKIPLTDFFAGNLMIFDIFIRLGKNHFVKILNKGNRFDPAVLTKYTGKGVKFLFFRTTDRKGYINQVNSFLAGIVGKNSVTASKKVQIIKGVTQQYIDEVYVQGVSPELVEEGNQIIDSVYTFLSRDSGIGGLLREFEEISPESYSHQFLVMFFSILVCKNLAWVSDSTVKIVAQGAILHDIGKLKLSPEIQNLRRDELSDKQLKDYEQHPRLGVEMLDRYPVISESVKQIVYQHHELITGEGFPLKLSGIKIYPLAKVVGFVDYFANELARQDGTPLDVLKAILSDRRTVASYDTTIVKALIQGFKK